MDKLHECPITGTENLPAVMGPKSLQEKAFTHVSEPILHQCRKSHMWQVYCASCFTSTGFYKEPGEAINRWNKFCEVKVDIQKYIEWPFEKKYPDHCPDTKHYKVLKGK